MSASPSQHPADESREPEPPAEESGDELRGGDPSGTDASADDPSDDAASEAARPDAPASPADTPSLALGEEAPEIVEERLAGRVRDLMRAWIRALKAKKMYPANNPVLSRIVREFQDALMGSLEDLDDLEFSVQPTELQFRGRTVYQNRSKRDSLPWRFHRDGITEISFVKGLTPPELNAFLDVLARATEPQGAEEDLVTILWEQEFSHIRYAYLAIDDLQEGLLEGLEGEVEGGESSDVSWPQHTAEGGYEIVIEEIAEIGEGSGERSDDWNALIPTVDVAERCPPELLELTPEELQNLAEEVHLEHSRPLTDIALEILTEVADGETHPDRFADLARAFSDLVIIAVADGDFSQGAQVLATFRTLAAERGLEANSFLPVAGDLVAQAVASLQNSPDLDVSALPEFFAHLGAKSIEPVCDLLQDVDLEAIYPQLTSAISLLAAQDANVVAGRLAMTRGRVARHILAGLAACPVPEVDAALARAVSHADARVRRDALQALARRKALTKPETRRAVGSALQDEDAQVRAAAIAAVREHPEEGLGGMILSMLEGERFREMVGVERQAFFETLARIRNPVLHQTLRDWATRPIWWPNSEQAERRTLAAWALARAGDDGDRSLLERQALSLFPGVRKACRRALEERVPPVSTAGRKP